MATSLYQCAFHITPWFTFNSNNEPSPPSPHSSHLVCTTHQIAGPGSFIWEWQNGYHLESIHPIGLIDEPFRSFSRALLICALILRWNAPEDGRKERFV
jgi:hypothetical protein